MVAIAICAHPAHASLGELVKYTVCNIIGPRTNAQTPGQALKLAAANWAQQPELPSRGFTPGKKGVKPPNPRVAGSLPTNGQESIRW